MTNVSYKFDGEITKLTLHQNIDFLKSKESIKREDRRYALTEIVQYMFEGTLEERVEAEKYVSTHHKRAQFLSARVMKEFSEYLRFPHIKFALDECGYFTHYTVLCGLVSTAESSDRLGKSVFAETFARLGKSVFLDNVSLIAYKALEKLYATQSAVKYVHERRGQILNVVAIPHLDGEGEIDAVYGVAILADQKTDAA